MEDNLFGERGSGDEARSLVASIHCWELGAALHSLDSGPVALGSRLALEASTVAGLFGSDPDAPGSHTALGALANAGLLESDREVPGFLVALELVASSGLSRV